MSLLLNSPHEMHLPWSTVCAPPSLLQSADENLCPWCFIEQSTYHALAMVYGVRPSDCINSLRTAPLLILVLLRSPLTIHMPWSMVCAPSRLEQHADGSPAHAVLVNQSSPFTMDCRWSTVRLSDCLHNLRTGHVAYNKQSTCHRLTMVYSLSGHCLLIVCPSSIRTWT